MRTVEAMTVVDCSELSPVARAVVTLHDGVDGIRLHQLVTLVEAAVVSQGSSVLGSGAVVARPDGHVVVPALLAAVPYDCRAVFRCDDSFDSVGGLDDPADLANLIDSVCVQFDPDIVGDADTAAEMLDDRLRDHPALVPVFRAARAEGTDVAVPSEVLAALSRAAVHPASTREGVTTVL